MTVHRREFLTLLAAGTLFTLTGCSTASGSEPAAERPTPKPTRPSLFGPPPPASARITLPPGPLTRLPGQGQNMALTVDDGTDPVVIEAYIRFAEETGARFTFFLNGVYPGWRDLHSRLSPLVDDGQIQLANHTWDHPWLTRCSDAEIADQLIRNGRFIRDWYGVEDRPYFRPPFGAYDDRVLSVAADVGYTAPMMWYGDLGDAWNITAQQLLVNAETYLLPQSIVIGHANHRPVTGLFGELTEIIRERDLAMVTLDDVFLRP